MRKTIFFFVLLATTYLHATVIDAIALIVDGEPVTTSEIRSLQTKGHMSKQQAVDLLIQDRLQKIAMKDIVVPEEDVDREIARIAQQNGANVKKMRQILNKQGIAWGKYRKTIKDGLKKRQFFQTKVASTIPMPTEEELKRFYNEHKQTFKIPSSIIVTEYAAAEKKKLQSFLQHKNTKGIRSKRITKKTKGMNPAMLSMLLQTPNGSFTPPMNAGEKWVTYKVHAKNGRVQMLFKAARNTIALRWKQQQEGEVLKDYFKKMKIEAHIQYLRK